MRLGTVLLLVGSLWLMPCQGRSANGYHALVGCGDGFLAAGSGGRLDWISHSGTVTKSVKPTSADLNALLCYPDVVFAAGDSGVLLLSLHEQAFRKVETGTDARLHCLARFKNRVFVGSEQGLLLVGDENGVFRSVQLALSGNIVSLSVRDSACFGVTDDGEVLHTSDGVRWTVFDFNAYYAGYYKPCRFTSILATEHQLAAAGVSEDGTPMLVLSSEGTVWTERSLNYTEAQGGVGFLKERPACLQYDASGDQILLVCGKGQVMKIPSCSHCNQLYPVSTENLTGLAQQNGHWMAVGEDFGIHVLEAGWN